jgi:hypothetical protein
MAITGPYLPRFIQIRPQYQDESPSTHENVLAFLASVDGPYGLSQLTAIQAAFDTPCETFWASFGATTNHYKSCWVVDRTTSSGLELAK